MRLDPRFRTPALLICLALAGCVEHTASAPSAARPDSGALAAEVSRLEALGFVRTDSTASDGSVRLAYSGPINGAVLCAPPGGQHGRVKARTALADGRVQTIGLDAYVTLAPGAEGVLAPEERDGLYAVSIVTQGPAPAVPTVQGITFGPGGQASFRSGLNCRAA